MTTTQLDARLLAAWEAVQAARMARRREKLLPAAVRAAERARGLLARAAPQLAADADRLAAVVRAELSMTDPTSGDPWALTREVELLRAEGVPAHRIARSAIRTGACYGPPTPPQVRACAASLRKRRERWQRSPVR